MTLKEKILLRKKSVFAFIIVFGPALFLIFIATRGCEHKFKVLKDFGSVQNVPFINHSLPNKEESRFSNFKGDILLITTIQTSCPEKCAVSFWHIDQMLYQHIRKNKRKKLKQVRIISFATDGFGNPLPEKEINSIKDALKDNVEGYDPSLWILATGDARKIYDFKENSQSLLQKGKQYYGGESFQELILLLDKKQHLRMVLPGNKEGLLRRMKEHLALLQKQYDKEKN
jgi:cytochrome oxidase Cu insertion factor (SCO1/SenC/PrrC family)